MTIEQFWSSTFREISIYRLASERVQLSHDRRTRFICYSIYLQYASKPIKRMTDLFPLPGDRSPKKWSNHLPGNYLTEEEFVEATKKRNEVYRQEREQSTGKKK